MMIKKGSIILMSTMAFCLMVCGQLFAQLYDLMAPNGGIKILNDAHDNKVIGNTVGYNGEFGVQVRGPGSVRNRISRNMISKNADAGILIEDGANEDITVPEIASFIKPEVEGTGVPGQILEFFSDEGNQGQHYLGTMTIEDTTGYFKYALPVQPSFSHITVTGIDAAGNTSQFSNTITATDVDQSTKVDIPRQMALHQNYPNPFNPNTEIRYSLVEKSKVVLTVHNIHGQKIRYLENRIKPAGTFSVIWDGRDDLISQVSSGVYFIVFRSGDFFQIRKALLIR